jgi:hypothetical protein
MSRSRIGAKSRGRDWTNKASTPIFADVKGTPQITKIQCRHCDGLGYRLSFNPDWARKKREDARLSLRHVATKMGVSAAYLCDLELGRRNFTDEMQDRFLEALQDGSR